jgi:hypothetical protein
VGPSSSIVLAAQTGEADMNIEQTVVENLKTLPLKTAGGTKFCKFLTNSNIDIMY